MTDKAYDKVQVHQEKVKNTFDRRVKEKKFEIDDLVLKWDVPKEEKHDNFDYMWRGPYITTAYRGHNSFFFHRQDVVQLKGVPLSGIFLKQYMS